MSDEIYREVILDYYRNPRNKGEIEKPDISAEDYNPLCGDKISFQMQINGNGMVDTAKFNGEGCAISQASASMLTEMVEGKNLDEMREMNKDDVLESLGTTDLGPVRIKCALLPLKVLKLGIYSYLGEAQKLKE